MLNRGSASKAVIVICQDSHKPGWLPILQTSIVAGVRCVNDVTDVQ